MIEVSDSMQTSVKHIYAIGDVVAGPALAHKASYEAKVAAAAMSGEDAHDKHYVIPAVAYTNIEVATVGETPQTVAEKKLDAKSSKFPFAASGRAMTMDQTEGFIRLVTDNPTGAIIGAQIVGPEASDLISELTLAIENGNHHSRYRIDDSTHIQPLVKKSWMLLKWLLVCQFTFS